MLHIDIKKCWLQFDLTLLINSVTGQERRICPPANEKAVESKLSLIQYIYFLEPWLSCLWSLLALYFCWFFFFLPLFPKNCYKNDVATCNVKYRHCAEPTSGACRDLRSLHLSDLGVILFSCCHLQSALWDAEHPWQALSTWVEPVLCRISPLTESFSWEILSVTACTRGTISVGKLFLLLHLSHGKEQLCHHFKAAHFLLNTAWLGWVVW